MTKILQESWKLFAEGGGGETRSGLPLVHLATNALQVEECLNKQCTLQGGSRRGGNVQDGGRMQPRMQWVCWTRENNFGIERRQKGVPVFARLKHTHRRVGEKSPARVETLRRRVTNKAVRQVLLVQLLFQVTQPPCQCRQHSTLDQVPILWSRETSELRVIIHQHNYLRP